ncbi:MAG: hypothetical protein ACOYO1_18145 [Bacteroidales bacterium]
MIAENYIPLFKYKSSETELASDVLNEYYLPVPEIPINSFKDEALWLIDVWYYFVVPEIWKSDKMLNPIDRMEFLRFQNVTKKLAKEIKVHFPLISKSIDPVKFSPLKESLFQCLDIIIEEVESQYHSSVNSDENDKFFKEYFNIIDNTANMSIYNFHSALNHSTQNFKTEIITYLATKVSDISKLFYIERIKNKFKEFIPNNSSIDFIYLLSEKECSNLCKESDFRLSTQLFQTYSSPFNLNFDTEPIDFEEVFEDYYDQLKIRANFIDYIRFGSMKIIYEYITLHEKIINKLTHLQILSNDSSSSDFLIKKEEIINKTKTKEIVSVVMKSMKELDDRVKEAFSASETQKKLKKIEIQSLSYKKHSNSVLDFLRIPKPIMDLYFIKCEYKYMEIEGFGEIPVPLFALLGLENVKLSISEIPIIEYARGFVDGYNINLIPFIDTPDNRKEIILSEAVHKGGHGFAMHYDGINKKPSCSGKDLYENGKFEGKRYKAWEVILETPNAFIDAFVVNSDIIEDNKEATQLPVNKDNTLLNEVKNNFNCICTDTEKLKKFYKNTFNIFINTSEKNFLAICTGALKFDKIEWIHKNKSKKYNQTSLICFINILTNITTSPSDLLVNEFFFFEGIQDIKLSSPNKDMFFERYLSQFSELLS